MARMALDYFLRSHKIVLTSHFGIYITSHLPAKAGAFVLKVNPTPKCTQGKPHTQGKREKLQMGKANVLRRTIMNRKNSFRRYWNDIKRSTARAGVDEAECSWERG